MLRDGRNGILLRLLVVQDDVLLPVGEDLLDGLVAVVAQHEPKPAGFEQAFVADPLSQSQYSLAGLVGLFPVTARLDHLRKVIPDRFPYRGGLVQKRVRIPLHVVLLGFRKMVGIRRIAIGLDPNRMGRHAFVLVVDAHGPAVVMQAHLFPDQ